MFRLMWVVIFVLGKPQRSDEATKKKHRHGHDEFLFLCRFLKLRKRIDVDLDAVVKLIFDWPVSKILRFLVKIKVLYLVLSRYTYMSNISMTTHENAPNSGRSVL